MVVVDFGKDKRCDGEGVTKIEGERKRKRTKERKNGVVLHS